MISCTRMVLVVLLAAQLHLNVSWRLPLRSSSPAIAKQRNDLTIQLKLASKFAGIILGVASCFSMSPMSALADSRLNAPSAAGTRVNSDPISLLRNGLPIANKEVRSIQDSLETAGINLKTRRINFARADAEKVQQLLQSKGESIIKAMPKANQEAGAAMLSTLKGEVPSLLKSIEEELAAGNGSPTQREALDKAYTAQVKLSKDLSDFQELLVPEGFQRAIPEEYSNLPRLNKRAEVEMIVKKPDDSKFDVDGKLYDKVRLHLVIDGYNAPLTGGNFIDLVENGFYNGMKINRADGFVVQTGDKDPEGTIHGYVPPGKSEERIVPLEIAVKGDDQLLYSSTTEDDGRGYAATVLPFQTYGALGMARSEYEADSASSQFFFLLFESDLTPAGKNLLDGRYACFGYSVDDPELLKDVKEGDIIESAKVIKGKENLILPPKA